VTVLFFTSWYPTADFTYGGVFVREHAKAVRDAGHRVVVLHLAGPSSALGRNLWAMEAERDPSLSEGIEAHHVFHRRISVRGASYPLYLWSAIAAHRRLRQSGFRADLVHAHVYGAAVPAALVANRNGSPLVVTEHFSGVAERSLSNVEAWKARLAYTHAARVLPVSGFLEQAIRSYGVSRPFEVVPNVVDHSLFFPDGARPRSGADRRLLFVGNLEPFDLKGFPMLLQALVRLRQRRTDWKLDVIGDGTQRVRHEHAAAELGLDGQVTFHGARPKPAVAQAMRDSDLLVVSSRVETFGAAVAEALVSGLPVVSTDVGGIPELVDDRSGRLVPPNDPVALADAVDETLDELDTFDRGAIAGAARDRFSPEAIGERLSRIYASVLAESRVGPTHNAGRGRTVSS
jgi:glycosyltransferase involved in cell wall biosynthesis